MPELWHDRHVRALHEITLLIALTLLAVAPCAYYAAALVLLAAAPFVIVAFISGIVQFRTYPSLRAAGIRAHLSFVLSAVPPVFVLAVLVGHAAWKELGPSVLAMPVAVAAGVLGLYLALFVLVPLRDGRALPLPAALAALGLCAVAPAAGVVATAPAPSFVWLCGIGWTWAVEAALDLGSSPDALGVNGRTGLRAAVDAGRLPTVTLLLSRGADPNLADSGSWTPLMSAASHENLAIVDALVAAGAHTAGALGNVPSDLAVARRLLDGGADPNAPGPYGERPLVRLVGSPDLVALLLDRGADPNACDERCPLQAAVAGGDRHAARRSAVFLLERGAHPDAASGSGLPPLVFAVRANDPELVRILLMGGAIVDTVNGGATALCTAVEGSHADLARGSCSITGRPSNRARRCSGRLVLETWRFCRCCCRAARRPTSAATTGPRRSMRQ